MGAWSLGSSPDKWTEILHQTKQNKNLRRCQPFELQAGTNDEITRIEDARKTESLEDSTWTSHLFRRHASQQTDHCDRKTTPSSGKENNPMHGMGLAQSNHQQMAQNTSCPSAVYHIGLSELAEHIRANTLLPSGSQRPVL